MMIAKLEEGLQKGVEFNKLDEKLKIEKNFPNIFIFIQS